MYTVKATKRGWATRYWAVEAGTQTRIGTPFGTRSEAQTWADARNALRSQP